MHMEKIDLKHIVYTPSSQSNLSNGQGIKKVVVFGLKDHLFA